MQFPDLSSVLHSVHWALVGAAATRLYMPERATVDLDILIDVAQSEEAHRLMTAAGAVRLGSPSIGGTSWRLSDGFPVHTLECDEPWCGEAISAADLNRDSAGLPVLPLAFLVLMKFRASRLQDIADITRMLGQASEEQLSATRSVFVRYEPEGLEDLESLVGLGRLEMN